MSKKLFLAVKSGETKKVCKLLDRGADVNARNDKGWTPLYEAARGGHTEAAALLLDRGADVNARDKDDMTPLLVAALVGHTEAAALLLDRGADVNARDKDDNTPLRVAAMDGHTETAALLVQRGGVGTGKEPMDANEWSDKGALLAVSGRYAEAIACYDKALKIDEDLAVPWFNKGKALAELGRGDEATQCVVRAANLGLDEAQRVCEQSGTLYKEHERDADARISEGIALGKLGKWREALPYYDEALELTPKNPKAYMNKGQSLRKLGRIPEAVESFQQFVKYAKPEDAEIVAAVKGFIAKAEAGPHELAEWERREHK